MLKLLKNCEILISQSSSAAYQASMLGKKAIVFGYSWFSECSAIHRYTSKYNLQTYLKKHASEEPSTIWIDYLNKMVPYLWKIDSLYTVCPVENTDFLQNLTICLEDRFGN